MIGRPSLEDLTLNGDGILNIREIIHVVLHWQL